MKGIFKEKTKIMLLIIIFTLFITSCKSGTSEIKMTDIDKHEITIDTEGFSKEQINALKDLSEGKKSMVTIIQSDLFTIDQLQGMNLVPASKPDSSVPVRRDYFSIDTTGLDIDDLDLDGLSDEQILVIKDVIAGEKTIQVLIDGSIFTMEELQRIGLFRRIMDEQPIGDFPAMDLSGIDINDLDLDGLSDEQIQVIKDVISGEKTIQSLIDDSIFTIEEIRGIGLFPDRRGSSPPNIGNETTQKSP